MNLISKLLLILVILFSSVGAFAINMNALYLSACKRELGVITGVDRNDVQLLRVDGTVVKVPRYEIIYWVYYPTDILPIRRISDGHGLPMVTVKTFHDNKLVDLIQGWPIDFSDTKISFLTPNGGEAVIERDSIWEISMGDTPKELSFSNQITRKYDFIHPYSFEYCPVKYEGSLNSDEKPYRVYPQQILSDPVVIKRELDRLKKGHEGIQDYDREQKFYAIPQLYRNITSLGMWLSYPSRYGASSSRTNLTPVLIDGYSSGPFGYQRIFLTGAAPMPASIHEEPQTQIYYHFKADYFHLQAMFDPNFLLVGNKYNWAIQDIPQNNDDRNNEVGFLEFGFDYGQFAFNFYPAGVVDTGIHAVNQFVQDSGNLIRYGLTYQNNFFKVDAQVGSSTYDQFAFKFFRANAEFYPWRNISLLYSLIYRNLTYSAPTTFQYSSTSYTNAVYLNYILSSKFTTGGYVSLESYGNQFGQTSLSGSSQTLFPKAGLFGALSF